MELREYAATIWKWLWLIILATAIAGFFAWWAVKDQPDIYQTSTTLMIGQAIQKVDPNYADFYTSERLAQTYSELIKREPILKNTARALGFEDQWTLLRGQIGVNLIPGTQLMEIRVTDNDPQRAKLIADEVSRQLMATVERSRPQDRNRQFIQTQAASLPPKIEAAQQEIEALQAELSEAFSARQIQDIQSRINTLENQINNWQATFAQYQLLLGETGTNVLTVIEEAPVPSGPLGSNWMLQVALAAAIGAALATGAAFLIEYLDDTLRSAEDAEKAMGLSTLGTIGRIPGGSPPEKLIAARHPRSPISEAYRSLRTSLRFSSLDRPLRSIIVTSPNALEGKSTMAANLSVVMAQTGQKVVLVDADLRRPMVHKIFQVSNKEGLTNILFEESPVLDGHLQESGVENLRVLPSGPLPPNPSELLGSQRMRRLLEQIKEDADIIVLDTPPILPVTDAAVLAPQTDGVLVVTYAGRTRQGAARHAVEKLRQVGANLLGVAWNRMSSRGKDGNYYYYYYYAQDTKGRRRRKRKRRHKRTY
jgi:succinoglycan biosynthesis transport protein ExoP